MSQQGKVLVIGGLGSIGSRYRAIMRHLDVDHDSYDETQYLEDFSGYGKIIICSPTDTHVEYLKKIPENITVLCEKPLAKEGHVPKRKNTYVVCNYLYLLRRMDIKEPFEIDYNFYKTGSDGLYWDCCQLLMIDPKAKLQTTSPRWNLRVNNRWARYRDLESSYVEMLKDFLDGRYGRMWTLEDGLEMGRRTRERIRYEDAHRNSGQIKQREIPGEDLRGSAGAFSPRVDL